MYQPSDHTFAVCAYKDNPFLEDTILSLKEQTVLGKILVSTSTPSAYIEGICERQGVPLVVNPRPNHAGDDWNWAYDSADTPLVTVAHQDDFYCDNYLERFLAALNGCGRGDVTLAFSDYCEIRNDEVVMSNAILAIKRVMNMPFTSDRLNASRFVKRRLLAFGNPICCPAALIVKENAGDSVFDTTFVNSCDYKTWVDMASCDGRFLYIPEVLMAHRIYEESATTRNIESNIRRNEDLEILEGLWPAPVARAVNFFFAQSERSNKL